MKFKTIQQFREYAFELRQKESTDNRRLMIVSCRATCCVLKGADAIARKVRSIIKKNGLEESIRVKFVGCLGFCEIEPVIMILPERIYYQKVKVNDVERIINESVLNNSIIEDLLYFDEDTGTRIERMDDIPFYKGQMRLLLGQHERIDPLDIDDYIVNGGYDALVKVLFSMTPEQVIEQVKVSGLRGRGGGGYPTGRKWEACRKASSYNGVKYVICNADEGDPGAYMDRAVLEGNPHSVIEGMIIGSYAIGASEGYIYVRAEYPMAVKHFQHAIKQAYLRGFLGENILDSGHSFNIKVCKGAGAFVCGESTALMASIEGQVGEPRVKHIHTVDQGLYELPTTLNNVETWANIPLIINKGADWYRSIGTESSKGTKIFSLVGKVKNTGLVEVPMGITLRQIVFDIGGGVTGKGKFKAVQTGGPSGGCVPEGYLDLPVDFDELVKAGSIMGSGGMIVMDDSTCMVDVARYFLSFLVSESCGKCTPCREGIYQLYKIVDRISNGYGKEEDFDVIDELCDLLKTSSLCAFGKMAANPVVSTVKYFKEEYEAHIKEKRCVSGVCKELVRYMIEEKLCRGCGKCKRVCPSGAIEGERKVAHRIVVEKCIKCGMCYKICPFGAVRR